MISGSENPYAPPLHDSGPADEEVLDLPLATRSQRFGGAMIDGLISGGIAFLITYLPIPWTVMAPWQADLLMFVFTLLGTLVVHGALLQSRGQTIGKAIVKIKIVSMAGRKPPLADLILRRYAFTIGMPFIPGIGQYLPLLDALFIFLRNRRCLHDWVAGTQVVQTTPAKRSLGQPTLDPSASKLSAIISGHLKLDPKQIPLTARWAEDLQISPPALQEFQTAIANSFPAKNTWELRELTTFGELLTFLKISRQSILQVPRSQPDAEHRID